MCAGLLATYTLESDLLGTASGTPLAGAYTDWDLLPLTDCECDGAAPDPGAPEVERETTTACNATGQPILLQYDVTVVPPVELSRWNLFTNAAEPAGALVRCAGGNPTLVADTVCANGTTPLDRVRVFDETNVLIGTVFYNQAGTVVAAPASFTVGVCQTTLTCLTCRAA